MRGLVVVTRPEPDATDYADELKEAGLDVFVEPMLNLEKCSFESPEFSNYDGILATSANALRSLGQAAPSLTVYCVGKHTSQAAEDVGFDNIVSIDGTGADVLAHVLALPSVKMRKFLHVCGQDLAFPLAEKLRKAGVETDSLVVYRSTPAQGFSDQFLKLLNAGKVEAVLFFSKRTAEAFIKNVQQSESESAFSRIKALSISDPVVECVRVLPWLVSYGSKTPDRAGMMQLLEAYVLSDGKQIKEIIP